MGFCVPWEKNPSQWGFHPRVVLSSWGLFPSACCRSLCCPTTSLAALNVGSTPQQPPDPIWSGHCVLSVPHMDCAP